MTSTDWKEELRRQVAEHPTTGCWIWQGRIDRNGYGKWRGPGWDIGSWAHRNAWFIHHGPIPSHLEIDHLCFRPTCVNVDHMELVTPDENKQRAAERRRLYRDAAPLEHGTANGFDRECRCDLCVAARPTSLAHSGSRITLEPTRLPSPPSPIVDLPFDLSATAWMAEASCAGADVDLWTKGYVGKRQLEEARQVCDTCPVQDSCFEYAMETSPDFGVWAGLRAEEFSTRPDEVAA